MIHGLSGPQVSKASSKCMLVEKMKENVAKSCVGSRGSLSVQIVGFQHRDLMLT